MAADPCRGGSHTAGLIQVGGGGGAGPLLVQCQQNGAGRAGEGVITVCLWTSFSREEVTRCVM